MNIQKVIKSYGWTLERLAAEMTNTRNKDKLNEKGISLASLSQIMNGNPTIDKLQEIADIIGAPLEELVADNCNKVYGFVEVNGSVHKVRSANDLERVTELARVCEEQV